MTLRHVFDPRVVGALAIGCVAVLAMLTRVAWTVGSAVGLGAEIRELRALALAEELARGVIAERQPASSTLTSGSMRARVGAAGDKDTRRIGILVDVDGEPAYEFVGYVLSGRAPPALGRPLALVRDVQDPSELRWLLEADDAPRPLWLTSRSVPRLADGVVERARQLCMFDRDDAIGLSRLVGGTDREDFVLASPDLVRLQLATPRQGVLHVPGNLWVVEGETPLTLQADVPLTIVVDGNLYLGRSVRVVGGPVVFNIRAGAGAAPVDVDLNGVIDPDESAGGGGGGPAWREGNGAVWFGLPPVGSVGQETLEFEPSVVAEGPVYQVCRAVGLGGSLVALAGVHRGASARLLKLHATHVPDVRCDPVPGFRTAGRPRPGRLRAP